MGSPVVMLDLCLGALQRVRVPRHQPRRRPERGQAEAGGAWAVRLCGRHHQGLRGHDLVGRLFRSHLQGGPNRFYTGNRSIIYAV